MERIYIRSCGPDSPVDMWTYLFQNATQSREEWDGLLDRMLAAQDRFHYAIVDKENGKAQGTFALMRIDQGNRVIEVGSVTYSPKLKRTRLATEAQYLLARYASLKSWSILATNGNAIPQSALKASGERLGFYLRRHLPSGGRPMQRDTDWLSMIDSDWPAVKSRLEKWLSPDNFDEKGQQIKALSEFGHLIEAGTKVPASQLSLNCRARRSG